MSSYIKPANSQEIQYIPVDDELQETVVEQFLKAIVLPIVSAAITRSHNPNEHRSRHP